MGVIPHNNPTPEGFLDPIEVPDACFSITTDFAGGTFRESGGYLQGRVRDRRTRDQFRSDHAPEKSEIDSLIQELDSRKIKLLWLGSQGKAFAEVVAKQVSDRLCETDRDGDIVIVVMNGDIQDFAKGIRYSSQSEMTVDGLTDILKNIEAAR